MPQYLLFYKPYGVLSKFTDREGRPTLSAYISIPRVYPAGRLDMKSEGLLLLTDDKVVLHRVTDPRWKLPKTYLVQVEGTPDEEALQRLRGGVIIKGYRTAPAEVELLSSLPLPIPERPVRAYGPTSWLLITLREGKKRQVRRMTAAVGHPTLRLIRISIGPLNLGTLQPGEWRFLTEQERQALFQALHIPPGGIRWQRRRQTRRRSQPRKRRPRK